MPDVGSELSTRLTAVAQQRKTAIARDPSHDPFHASLLKSLSPRVKLRAYMSNPIPKFRFFDSCYSLLYSMYPPWFKKELKERVRLRQYSSPSVHSAENYFGHINVVLNSPDKKKVKQIKEALFKVLYDFAEITHKECFVEPPQSEDGGTWHVDYHVEIPEEKLPNAIEAFENACSEKDGKDECKQQGVAPSHGMAVATSVTASVGGILLYIAGLAAGCVAFAAAFIPIIISVLNRQQPEKGKPLNPLSSNNIQPQDEERAPRAMVLNF